MMSNCLAVSDGQNQRISGSKRRPVWLEEKESVESRKIIAAQTRAGHQARKAAARIVRGGTWRRTSSRLGAGRGLRQGSVAIRKRIPLFIVNEPQGNCGIAGEDNGSGVKSGCEWRGARKRENLRKSRQGGVLAPPGAGYSMR